eukprot:11075328-Alexandrium_andersonii.AAC.1
MHNNFIPARRGAVDEPQVEGRETLCRRSCHHSWLVSKVRVAMGHILDRPPMVCMVKEHVERDRLHLHIPHAATTDASVPGATPE